MAGNFSKKMLLALCAGICCFSGATQAKVVSGKVTTDFDSTMGFPDVVVRLTWTQNGTTFTLRDTTDAAGLWSIGNIPSQITSVSLLMKKIMYANIDTTITLSTDSVFVTLPMSVSMYGNANRVIIGRILAPGSNTGASMVPFRFYAYGLGSPITYFDTTAKDGTFKIAEVLEACTTGWVRTEEDAPCRVDTSFKFNMDGDTTTVIIYGHPSNVSVLPGFPATPNGMSGGISFVPGTLHARLWAGTELWGFGVDGRRIFSVGRGADIDISAVSRRGFVVVRAGGDRQNKNSAYLVP